jgi:hypothetical protein
MADQLTAHCRLPRAERRVMPVQQGTFALVEWGLEEDPAGLDGLVELPPEGELPYRGRERHPVPSRELARGSARGEGRGEGRDGRSRRRDEEERRGRRFPPPAEVTYEILAGAGKPLAVVEIAAIGAERLLMPDAFVRDAASLRAALVEDNRRREGAGRKALFQIDDEAVTLVAQPEPGERAAVPAAPRGPAALQDIRRTALAALRRRLRECDGPTVEHIALKLLERMGFRDLKVAKRGREHVVCTGRRRMGLADVRHAVRVVRSGADAGRRDVVDVRRDVGHYGAQIGVVLTPGDAGREARGEAGAAGQLPVVLLCGEALAEALADAGVGCVPVVVPDVDEAFFRTAAEAAEREEVARRARREERERREAPRRDEAPDEGERTAERPAGPPEPREVLITSAPEPVASAGPGEEPAEPAEPDEVDEGDGGDEGDEEGPEAEGPEAPGARASGEGEGAVQGERRRRRRRRRRRGGRGRGTKEAGGPGAPAPAEGGGGAARADAPAPAPPAEAAPPAPAAEPAPPPPREPTGGEGT